MIIPNKPSVTGILSDIIDPDGLLIDKETSIQLYHYLKYQYVDHTKFPLILKLINAIVARFPDVISR